jgi:hypothetical protein
MQHFRIPLRAALPSTVLLFAILASSCDDLKHPLIEPEKAKLDERLLGAWRFVKPDDKHGGYSYLFIGRSGDAFVPAGIMKAVSVDTNGDHSKLGSQTQYFFPAEVGNVSLAHIIENAKPLDSGYMHWDRSKPQYQLLKYVVDKDKLAIYPLDYAAVKDAVVSGKLRGTVAKKQIHLAIFLEHEIDEVQLDESAENLSRFLSGGGEGLLFPERLKMSFVKLN